MRSAGMESLLRKCNANRDDFIASACTHRLIATLQTPGAPTNTAISGRSSGSRIVLPAAPSQPGDPVLSHQTPGQWHHAAIVPEYSGGSTVDSHHLPFSSPLGDTAHRDLFNCQSIEMPIPNAPPKLPPLRRACQWKYIFPTAFSGQPDSCMGTPLALCRAAPARKR